VARREVPAGKDLTAPWKDWAEELDRKAGALQYSHNYCTVILLSYVLYATVLSEWLAGSTSRQYVVAWSSFRCRQAQAHSCPCFHVASLPLSCGQRACTFLSMCQPNMRYAFFLPLCLFSQRRFMILGSWKWKQRSNTLLRCCSQCLILNSIQGILCTGSLPACHHNLPWGGRATLFNEARSMFLKNLERSLL